MIFKNLSFIIIFSTIGVFAQNEFNFGIKGGVNGTGFHVVKSAGTDRIGINVGGMAEYQLNDSFSLQSELLYNSKGGKLAAYDLFLNAYLDYLDVPLQVKYYFIKKMSFDFGTQFGILINSKAELYSGEKVELIGVKDFDFSINGGFSYKFENNLIIQSRYNFGLSEIFENERFKTSMISLSLGYYFN